MNIQFLQQLNELIIEADADDSNIMNNVDNEGFLTSRDVEHVKVFVSNAINASRKQRLEQMRASFNQHREQENNRISSSSRSRPPAEMLVDIVKAMQNTDRVPKGLLLAFREQNTNQAASEEDIKKIWESLYQLGLINDEGNQEE